MRRRRPQFIDSKDLLSRLGSETITRFGVRMLHDSIQGRWKLKDVGNSEWYSSKRACLMSYFESYGRRYGTEKAPYVLKHQQTVSSQHNAWRLYNPAGTEMHRWLVRPNRSEIAAVLRKLRASDPRPSFKRPDSLGWRTFGWHPTKHCLVSPVQGTLWTEPEMRVEKWDERDAVRGAAGIHACRLPRGDWRTAQRPHDMPQHQILCLVERFGKFVLGKEGWRAEWVFIKEILAPDEAAARALRRVYPELPISVAREGHWLKGGR